ncbi:MAG: acetate/propionate family kinase [Rhodoplanes sp.]|jgi:acetate kinase
MSKRKGILVINGGSTSVKFAGYRHEGGEDLRVVCRGQVEGIGSHPSFVAKGADGKPVDAHDWEAEHPLDQDGALRYIFDWLNGHMSDVEFVAAGHRVVLGGVNYERPVLVTDQVLADLDALCAFEPSHQPYEIAAIRAVLKANPSMPQVACFDTSFHRTMPRLAQMYALPREYREGNLRHWGYHGISYDYISRQVPQYAPDARRIVVAHLGGGCSICAMADGKSVDTSLGFSAVDGLPMSTRSGEIDAGILLHLLKVDRMDPAALEKLLYKQSGLLGISGISGDMRELEESKAPEAAEAIDYFVYHIVKFVGAYTAVLGGLDALVFTAGIGEHSSLVRGKVCEKLGWLGVTVDAKANAANGPRISAADSRVSVFAIPTNEELMIARHTLALAAP